MTIIRAAVGDTLKDFGDGGDLDDVWSFINSHMASSEREHGIVLMDDSGKTHAEIWDSSLYFAHWKTPRKMRAYLDMAGFDLDN